MHALASAWVATEDIYIMASSMIINFMEIVLNPEYMINPKIIKVAPVDSMTETACILVKTSGILISPMAPTRRNNDPIIKKK